MIVVLAHGASGDASSMAPHVDGLARRGIVASAIDLPVRRAQDAVTAYRSAVRELADDPRGVVIGGHSYGGRVASLLAAQGPERWAGIILLSYPLHRPGAPEGERRIGHWSEIPQPVLLLSGESDPFARIDLLRSAVAERLPRARLVTYPGAGHGLISVLDDVLDRIADFVGGLARRPV